MKSFFHDEVGALWIGLDNKFVTAQVASHVKRIDWRAQILTNFVFLRIEPNSLTDTFETAFTPHVEHHFEADHIAILFDDALSLVISVKGAISLRIEVFRIKIPVCLRCCQATHLNFNFINFTFYLQLC